MALTLNTSTQKWENRPAAAGTVTLKTQGTYLDRDIDVITAGGSVDIGAVTFAKNPTISWDSTNKVIKATWSEEGTITSTTTSGWVTSDDVNEPAWRGSGTSTATLVSLDSKFIASNIKNGVTIFGVTGTHVRDDATVTPTTGITATSMDTYFTTGNSTSNSVILTPWYTTTGGYVAAATQKTNGGTAYYTIKDGALVADAGSVTLNVGAGDSASASNPSLQWATTTPSSGVYYTLTGKGKGTVKVGTTGWLEANTSKTSNEATANRYVAKSVLGTAQEGTVPTGTNIDLQLQPDEYVKIPAGYYPSDRYIYAQIADESSEATKASQFSLDISSISSTAEVTPGTKSGNYYPLSGTISATGTFTAGTPGWFTNGSATDSSVTGTVGKIAAGVLGKSGKRVSVTTGGYIPKDTYLDVDSGSYNLDISGTPTVKPAISKTTTPTNVTNAASGNATTTAPSSGVYVAVQSAAATNTLTPTAAVTTGWITNSQGAGTTGTVKAGATQSDVTYVPITTATPAFDGGELTGKTASISATNVTVTETDNTLGMTILAKGTAGRAAVQYNGDVKGWVDVTDNAVASDAVTASTWNGKTYYIDKVTLGTSKIWGGATTPGVEVNGTVYVGTGTTTGNVYVNGTQITSNGGMVTSSLAEGLVTDTTKTTGSSHYRVYTASAGYINKDVYKQIPVYQGATVPA